MGMYCAIPKVDYITQSLVPFDCTKMSTITNAEITEFSNCQNPSNHNRRVRYTHKWTRKRGTHTQQTKLKKYVQLRVRETTWWQQRGGGP